MQYARIYKFVFDRAVELNSNDFRVYATLCFFANGESNTCFPAHKKIKELSGIKTDKTFYNSINKLLKKKLIKRSLRDNKSTLYEILTPTVNIEDTATNTDTVNNEVSVKDTDLQEMQRGIFKTYLPTTSNIEDRTVSYENNVLNKDLLVPDSKKESGTSKPDLSKPLDLESEKKPEPNHEAPNDTRRLRGILPPVI